MTTMVALRMIAEYARLQEACAAEFRRFAKTAREAGDAELVGANVWLGVSVEDRAAMRRLDELRRAPAAVRFVSAEPLLESLAGIDLAGIHWLIAGGESGPHARPCPIEWVRELRDATAEQGVAFFFKQWGGRTPKSGGRDLDGRTHDAVPARVGAVA